MFKPWLKPEAETKPDLFSLDALIVWLRSRNSSEEYNPSSNETCLVCQYGDHIGMRNRHGIVYSPTSAAFFKAGMGNEIMHIAHEGPFTFGAALSRALSLRATQ